MKNKNILLVFHDHGMSGGTLALLDLIGEWKKTEYNFVCLLPKKNPVLENKLKELNCNLIIIRYWQAVWNLQGSSINKIKRLILLALGILNIIFHIDKIKRYNFIAVYSNTSSIYIGIIISKLLKISHIWHIREFVSEEHGVYPLLGEKRHYKIISKYGGRIITISNSLMEFYSQKIANNNIQTIYDDVSPIYYLDDISPWKDRKNNILVVGNISPGKRQDIVIRALNMVDNDDIKVYFAGRPTDNHYYLALLEKINTFKLQNRVIFLGQVNNMNDIRKQMGIGVISSYKEAFGRVTIEGMLAGMIMIGAEDSGTKELIRDRENGFLFELDNYNELAKIIKMLNECDNNSSEKIIKEARLTSRDFIKGNCANELIRVFRECEESV